MERSVALSPGVELVQDSRFFPLTQDSVLLAAFARPKRGRGLDLGAGQGFLSILLGRERPDLTLEGLELLPEAAAIAEENARRAGVSLPVRRGDLRDLPRDLHGRYDFCLCNPPYFQRGRGKLPAGDPLARARSDEGATIGQVCRAAFLALKTGGRLYLCFPAGRLAPLLAALEGEDLAAKRLQPVYPRRDRPARLILLEAVKQGGPGADILPPWLPEPSSHGRSHEQ